LKLIRISFRAIEVAEIDMADMRQLKKRTWRQAARDFVCLFAFSVGGTMSTSLFWLMAESKAVFILSRVWTTMGLLNKSKINCILIKEDESRDKAYDCTDICIRVLVRLIGLAMHVQDLIDGRRQQITNW
jgi:hypothetical protein